MVRCAADFPKKTLLHRAFREVKVLNLPPSSASAACVQDLDDAQLRTRVDRATAELVRRCVRIRKAETAGHHRKARSLVARMLVSVECKIAVMVQANRGLPQRERISLRRAVQSAYTMSVRHASPELACAYEILKADGRLRPIVKFGLLNRARQLLVMKALVALHGHRFPEWQFGMAGKGRDACAIHLSEKVQSTKASHFAEVDIKNFFGSINAMGLRKEIGLPDVVIRYVLCAKAYRYRVSKGCLSPLRLLQACRTGIPQGSIVSPIVAAIVVSLLVKGRVHANLINYADNFAIVGNSEIDVTMQIKDLAIALTGNREYGNFLVSKTHRSEIEGEGWDFLGYHWEEGLDGAIVFEPSDSAFARGRDRLIREARTLRKRGCRLGRVRNALLIAAKCWIEGFKLTSNFRRQRSLRELCHYLVSTPLRKVPAATLIARSERRSRKDKLQWKDFCALSILLGGN